MRKIFFLKRILAIMQAADGPLPVTNKESRCRNGIVYL